MEYQRLPLRRYAPVQEQRVSSESRYWKRFRNPIVTRSFGQILNVSFNPRGPHDFIVSSSTRNDYYQALNREVKRSITQLAGTVFAAEFRPNDGKLITFGCEDGTTHICEPERTRAPLRTMKGHHRPVRAVRWAEDLQSIFSGSEDGIVKQWDVSTGDEIATFKGHSDHVRSLFRVQPSSTSGNGGSSTALLASASYDHTVKVWDVRASAPAFTLEHKAPVECLTTHESCGALLFSAARNTIYVWDLLGGGRCMHEISNHQKTITTLQIHPRGGRLISGGLDHFMKVYDLASFSCVHSQRYNDPILSLGVSPDARNLVVGMSTGMLSIRQRSHADMAAGDLGGAQSSEDDFVYWDRPGREGPSFRTGSVRYFLRGKSAAAGMDDLQVEAKRRQRLRDYDRFLKSFQYRDALDAALAAADPVVFVTLVEELSSRGAKALETALAGRDDVDLLPLLRTLVRYITNPRFSSTMISVADVVLDIYSSVAGLSMEVDDLLLKLGQKLRAELRVQTDLIPLLGALEQVLVSKT